MSRSAMTASPDAPGTTPPNIAGTTTTSGGGAWSTALSKDLRKRGFRFVGPTTVYAAMQALGIVNDHLAGCASGAEVDAERAALLRRVRSRNEPATRGRSPRCAPTIRPAPPRS